MKYAWALTIFLAAPALAAPPTLTYPIVDTGLTAVFSDTAQLFTPPKPGQPFFGQDGFYRTHPPAYRDNKDGTVTDLVTGLEWQVEPGQKLTFEEALAAAKKSTLAGHTDWRVPTIKELYSLINFNGNCRAQPHVPYIDTRVFKFTYGDETKGERVIDSQYWSATEYVGTTMHNNATVFGVNFADGRIKGYPKHLNPSRDKHFLILCRGNSAYGKNQFVDNKDATVSDLATGLMWSRDESAKPLNWADALAYANACKTAGYSDWRLPSAKELQSLVDYTRAPDASDPTRRGPAIDPVFKTSIAEPYEWTATTHMEASATPGGAAVYIAFGRAMGTMQDPRTGQREWLNVHGAGAQRSDPKSGNAKDFPQGRGPQGDDIRILNYVRPVRTIAPGATQVVAPSTVAVPRSAGPGGSGPREGPPMGPR